LARQAGRGYGVYNEIGVSDATVSAETNRHTVKPWFQGKIPFAFNLPELQNNEFSLVGGRMTYLEPTPRAHLTYDARKHHISVSVFPERSLPARLTD
jgi:anti-sigma factor RsiW